MASRDTHTDLKGINASDFAALGTGKLAYIKVMKSDEVKKTFPGTDEIKNGIRLFALLAADGSPILLTDSRDIAMNSAWEHELATVQLH
jgi:hypothetical protein